MPRFVCAACAAQFPDADAPPPACPICEDERRYVPEDGQRWTTLEELARTHRNEVREDGELTGVGTDPSLAIRQRALLVPRGDRFVMWDCVTYFDDDAANEVERRGGLAAIAISHPHYYSGMADWAARFGCPVLLRSVVGADRSPRREGDRAPLGAALRARAARRAGPLDLAPEPRDRRRRRRHGWPGG